MKDKICSREGCTQKAWTKIKSDKQECFEHYLETLTIAEMIRRFTGIPAIQTAPEVESNAR